MLWQYWHVCGLDAIKSNDQPRAGHPVEFYKILTGFKNVGDHRQKDNFNLFFQKVYSFRTLTLDNLSRSQDHVPSICGNVYTMAIPQTWDLTGPPVIKFDSSRKTNMEDDQHRQLAVLASVMLCTEKPKKIKNVGQILAEKTESTWLLRYCTQLCHFYLRQ